MVSATRSSSRLAGESSKIPKTSSKRTKGKKNASPSPEPEETIAVKAGPSRRTSTRRSNRKRDHRQDIKEPFSTVKRRRTSTRQSRSTGTSTAATPAASFSGYSHDGQTETPATHLSDFSDDDEALDQMLESHSLKRLATTVEADLDDEDLDLMLERDPTSSRPFKADLDDEDLDLMLERNPTSSRPFKRLATPVDASLDDDNSEDSDAEHQSDVMDEDEDYYADQEIQHYTQEKAAASAAIGQSSSELSDVPDEFGSEPDSVSDEDFYNCMLSCEPVQRKGKAKGRAKSILPSYDQESDDSDDSCYRSERYLSPEDDDESRFFRAARFGYTVSRRRSGKDVAQQFHGPEEKDFDKNFINKYEYDESGEFTGPNPEDTRFLVNHDDRHTLFDDYIAHDFAIKDKKKDHVPWIVPWNPLKKRIAAEKDAREAARKAAIAAFVATTDPEDYIYHQSDEEGEDGAQPIGRIPFFYESDAEWRAGRKYTKMQCQDFTVKAMGIKGREPDYDHRKDWLVAAWTAGDIFPLVRARHGWDRADVEHVNLFIIHPELRDVWKDLDEYPRIRPREDPQPPGLALNLLPFQKEGLHWLRLQEQSKWRGGILADEMGMGKTIQTLCLIMTDPNAKPNLVVAPTVAIMQWKSEIEKYTGNALRVYIFHGAKRTTDWKELSEYNVILTSYNLLESVYRKQESGYKRKAGTVKEVSALHQVDYHRVILDEAHNIKDRSCNTAKAVFALKTKYKLCLSGTPLQNRIGELFSLLRFLEVDPFAYYYCRKCPCKSLHWKFSDQAECDKCGHGPMNHVCFFNHECLKPIQKYGYEGLGEEAFLKIKKLLKHIMLRRTKREREDDLGLPPKIMSIRRDKFSEEELDLYNSIYSDAHRKFDTYVAQGVLLNNYANIFALITRMRQIADHPDLFLRKEAVEGQNNNIVCGVCDEIAEEPIKSKCHHTFCRDCAQRYITGYIGDSDPDCPKCHIPLIIDLTAPAIEAITAKKSSIINRIDMSKWRSSTKIEALCEELHKLRRKDQTVKSIVFSQFTSMLQLIEWRLKHAGFKCVMLEGTMSPAQRDATIQHFMKTVDVDVFLVSLRAGGVALNLIEASQVFLMEPWWNPSVEWQAADRIHRIGQTRVCRITRLIIEDSIESRIVELQEKKASMIDATVNADYSAMNKLTAADMEFLFQN